MKSTREERGTHSVIAFIQESRKHRLSQNCKSVVPGDQGREKWWRVFCFTSCCCEEEFISSHSLQPIMQGHQDRDTRKEFKAGTEAETPEEPCSLACSHGLFSLGPFYTSRTAEDWAIHIHHQPRECPTDMATSQSEGGSSSIEISPSQACHANNQKVITEDHGMWWNLGCLW